MSRLLPSRPDLSTRDEPEPRLVRIDERAADEVFEALGSATARTIFGALHEEPETASRLAEAADTSVQNSRYHLEKLQAADLVEVAGTQYSSKGREMDVYAPADEPLVMLASTDEPAAGLRALLGRLTGAVAATAILSLLVHAAVEGDLAYLDFTGAGGAGGGQPALPLASALFLGGLAVLAVALAWWHWAADVAGLWPRVRRYPVLSGRDLAASRRAALAAAAAGLAVAALWLGLARFDVVLRAVGPFGPAQALAVALLATPAAQAYANDGLLVSWTVVFGPLLGLGLASLGLGLAGRGLAYLPGAIGYPVLLATVGAVAFGTVGFLAGVGLRWLVRAALAGGERPDA